MSADALALLREQNRLLRQLTKAVLTSGPYGLPFTRDHPTSVYSTKGLVLPAGKTVTPVDLKDTDLNFALAQSTFNSNTVRHRMTTRTGEGGIFTFDATQQELAATGLTSPNIGFLWTPSGVGGSPAGTFMIVYTPGTPLPLHEFFKIELVNEGTSDATASAILIVWVEVNKKTRSNFADVLLGTVGEERPTGRG